MNAIYQSIKIAVRRWLIKKPWLFELALRTFHRPNAKEVMTLRRLIHPGDIVFDIGANVGQFTCLLSSLVGTNGRVHVFEPIPDMFSQLEINIKQNLLPSKIFLNQCALSDKNGFTPMFVPGSDFSQASIVKHNVASWADKVSKEGINTYEKVRAVTLDTYVVEHNVGDISFIKCDVEGAELLVLRGAKSVLKRDFPPILFLEVYRDWTKDFGYEPEDLFNFLRAKRGYEFIHLGKEGLKKVSGNSKTVTGIFPDFLNFLCYVPSVHNNRICSLLDITNSA